MLRTPSLPPTPTDECTSEENLQEGRDTVPMLPSRQTYLEQFGIQSSGYAGSAEAFRGKFLQKLAHNNVWVQQARRPPKHQSVIIFDWDDTLCCTTFLNKLGDEPVSADTDLHLRKIAHHIRGMLETALKSGPTYIITNAASGWVEHSARKWLPELLPVLQQVQIISARDKFEAAFPDDVNQWKVQAFLEVQRLLDHRPITNLVALGDADFEMEAARIMGGKFEEALIKTVKFRPHPTPLEHLKQVELVAEKFLQIVRSGRSTKVILERRQPRGRAATTR